jgi:hypothetical protein
MHALTGIVFIASVALIDRPTVDNHMNLGSRNAHVLQHIVAQPGKRPGREIVLAAGMKGFAGHPDFPSQGPRRSGWWRLQGDG